MNSFPKHDPIPTVGPHILPVFRRLGYHLLLPQDTCLIFAAAGGYPHLLGPPMDII